MGWFYYHFDPAGEVFFLKCPFRAVTGLQCPGCGSQRAVHELLHFNFGNAWHYNPLLILAIPYAAAGFVFSSDRVKMKFPRTRKFLFGSRAIYMILLLILIFWIVRNL